MTIDFNQTEIETLIELLDAAELGYDPVELLAAYEELNAALSEQTEAK
ncbi:hypothetical protein ACLEEJ_00345 [Lonsdalea quercina]